MNAVESFIMNLPKPHAKLMFELRDIILQSLPGCEEKINYKVPFYSYLRGLCYLYIPAKQKDIVALGFCQGAQLSNVHGLLTGDGKFVRLIEFDIRQTYDMDLVRETIQEAVLLQEILYKKK
ncbi:DUF1801 domain-containing protein [Reichenbachiella sp. MALMAid0571]|uniref:DUF1801 domain-containing protein n=1 Tax=Reichenbachiella sp. MALMAid0571 TaxID=3143939 RepID=UPI0032DF136B